MGVRAGRPRRRRARAGTLTPDEPHLVAALDQAWADHHWHSDQTIFGYLDVFLTAIQRPYRCKDWMFARLVRYGTGAELRDLLHDPEQRITDKTWRRWLDRQHGA